MIRPLADVLLAPLPTPWGHRHGTPCGSGLSRYPGPLAGEVTARWTPPASANLSSGPIVTTDGRVVVALQDRVVFLDPGTLLPIGEVEMQHAEVTAADQDAVLAAAYPGSFRIGPDRRAMPIPLGEPWDESRARMIFDLTDGRLLVIGLSILAVLESDGTISRAGQLKARMSPTIGVAALAPDGRLFAANATSWSSEDDPVEYNGHAAEISLPSAEIRWMVGEEIATQVTSTGFRLRLIALPQGVLLAEQGALVLSGRGHALYVGSGDDVAKPPLVVDGRELFHARGHPVSICRTWLPEATGDTVPPAEVVLKLEDGESLYDMVGAAGHLYAATSQRLFAFTRDGQVTWQTKDVQPYQLACGNGCLFAVERPLRLSRIG